MLVYTCMSGLSVKCIRTHFCDFIIYMNCVLNYTKYGLTVFKPKRTQIPTSWRVRKDVETGGKGEGNLTLLYDSDTNHSRCRIRLNVIPQKSAVV